jgi:RimJ/RimL family protein N-acetyltransferase
MLDSLTLPPLPTLHGERVILRGPRDSDVDDRLHHPIDPEEEDGYGSSWRREWDGRRYHTRELGREVTRLVLAWAFDVLGVHRVELQALASNSRAINCYLACGFRQEGVRREAELYPDGWKDFVMMGILRSEHADSSLLPPVSDGCNS